MAINPLRSKIGRVRPEIFPKVAAKEYLNGIETVGFNSDKIPDFAEVNSRLKSNTGWQLQVVPSIIPNEDFFPMIAQKIFPATITKSREP